MGEWMGEWMSGWMGEWMDGWTGEWPWVGRGQAGRLRGRGTGAGGTGAAMGRTDPFIQIRRDRLNVGLTFPRLTW
jgi:hypothetical protein